MAQIRLAHFEIPVTTQNNFTYIFVTVIIILKNNWNG
jgi:hypothetical protein